MSNVTSTQKPQALLNQQQEPRKKKGKRPDSAVPTQNLALHAECDRFQGALRIHGATAGVKINTADAVKGDGDQLRNTESAYHQACADLRSLNAQLQAMSGAAQQFLKDVRHLLTRQFGPKANAAWADAGFEDNTLAIPRAVEERAVFVKRLTTYLAGHPDVEQVALGISAENGSHIHTRLTQLLNEVDSQTAKVSSLRDRMKTNRVALRKRLGSVRSELGMLLAEDDQRWLAFDLTPPAVIKERRKQKRAATLKAKAAAQAQQSVLTIVPEAEPTAAAA